MATENCCFFCENRQNHPDAKVLKAKQTGFDLCGYYNIDGTRKITDDIKKKRNKNILRHKN